MANKRIEEHPRCDLRDCFANHNGTCNCLSNADFTKKKCSFYKPKKDYKTELEKLKKRR